MGYIELDTITFTTAPGSNQAVNVQYKLVVAASYTSFPGPNNVLVSGTTGTFSPTLYISPLATGSYMVTITPTCGGSPITQTYNVP